MTTATTQSIPIGTWHATRRFIVHGVDSVPALPSQGDCHPDNVHLRVVGRPKLIWQPREEKRGWFGDKKIVHDLVAIEIKYMGAIPVTETIRFPFQ